MTQNQMLRREPEGNWSYQYFSLIDPQSADSSYMTSVPAGVVPAEDQAELVSPIASKVSLASERGQRSLNSAA